MTNLSEAKTKARLYDFLNIVSFLYIYICVYKCECRKKEICMLKQASHFVLISFFDCFSLSLLHNRMMHLQWNKNKKILCVQLVVSLGPEVSVPE